MNNGLLLWVDDEVELLKAHIIFLEKKGYQVVTVSNGADAIEQCRQQTFDLILLDEMMPGLSGLETLQQIKDIQPATPVVMCTKSEEEDIMNQAIGSKIADYLIKPVNPNQILLSLKKNIHQREIVSEVTQSSYQQEYQQLAMQIMDSRTWKDWMDMEHHIEEKQDHIYRNHTVCFQGYEDPTHSVADEAAAWEQQKAGQRQEQAHRDLLLQVRSVLTETQYRRAWMYYAEGKDTYEIAQIEGTCHQAISQSLNAAQKKIFRKLKKA